MIIYKVSWNIHSDSLSTSIAIVSSSSSPGVKYKDSEKSFVTKEKALEFENKLKDAARILNCEFNLRTRIQEEVIEE